MQNLNELAGWGEQEYPVVSTLSLPLGEVCSLFPLKAKSQLGPRCFYHNSFFLYLLLGTCPQRTINIFFLITGIHRALSYVRLQNWTEIQAVTKRNVCFRSLVMLLMIIKPFSHVKTSSSVYEATRSNMSFKYLLQFYLFAWLNSHFSCVLIEI